MIIGPRNVHNLDVKGLISMNRVRKRIRLEEIQDKLDCNSPLTIAVLDSGISNHPDLDGCCIAFHDFVQDKQQPYDDSGHGTHVCGTLCGNGSASAGKYKGVMGNAKLVVGKVLDNKGEGQALHMLEGLDWVLRNRVKYDIRLLNISVGIGGLKDRQKMMDLKQMTEKLWDAGVVVICAAGNKGPADGSISAIGGLDKVITVGCFDDMERDSFRNSCERYSGRGAKSASTRKPDLVAPGSNIVSCNYEFDKYSNSYRNYYTAKSGTSMATPIVTGCAGLLLQREPDLTNEKVKERLHYSAEDLNKPWNLQGWGMIDARNLLEIL